MPLSVKLVLLLYCVQMFSAVFMLVLSILCVHLKMMQGPVQEEAVVLQTGARLSRHRLVMTQYDGVSLSSLDAF